MLSALGKCPARWAIIEIVTSVLGLTASTVDGRGGHPAGGFLLCTSIADAGY
jgi:hypothetical protein